VVEVMERVDYGMLDAFGCTIGLCAETLALAELGRPADAVAKATACYDVVDTSPQSSFLGQPLAEFHTFALQVCGYVGESVEVAEAHLLRSRERPATAQSVAAAIVGMAALAAGDLPAALRHLPAPDAGADDNFVLANSAHRFLLLRAQALARLGDVLGADAALRAAESQHHPAYVYVESTRLLAQAWLAAVRERMDSARRITWAAARFARDHHQLAREVACLRTAVQFGDTTVCERLTELATLVGGPRAPLAARYALALRDDDACELS
jgi:hypothetical protein